jgi:hypothetical protein
MIVAVPIDEITAAVARRRGLEVLSPSLELAFRTSRRAFG